MYFVLVSAALAAFCLVLYGLGLFSVGFAVLYCFTCFALVSAAPADDEQSWNSGYCQLGLATLA